MILYFKILSFRLQASCKCFRLRYRLRRDKMSDKLWEKSLLKGAVIIRFPGCHLEMT